MNSKTKVLLIILGSIFLIGVGVFIWGKATGKLASSASYFDTKGDIKGKVTDKATGALLGGVSVVISKVGGGQVASISTSATGDSQGNNYRKNDLEPFAYEIVFSKSGYQTIRTTRTLPPRVALQVDAQMEKIQQTGTLKGTIKWKSLTGTVSCLPGATKPGTTDTTPIPKPSGFSMTIIEPTENAGLINPQLQINCGYTVKLPVLPVGKTYTIRTSIYIPAVSVTPYTQLKDSINIVKDGITGVDWLLVR